ncbi:metalloendopeptidase [Brumimicrobium salinarum]|uniref:Metalloendopeptidase n=1 Tax=Brumimicrobium salinarum TaxID=2058658 RepID=A0A2I0R090_9FLAO|nr:M23 family metallopeptidase [Brumimicrobium salinarum]PKR79994.1 metalloendopeptidase [Brumimicrobium salinarum]
MKFIFILSFFCVSIQVVIAQKVKDTLDTPNGKMIIYENRTWEYLEDINFDGVLNDYVHNYFVNDSILNFQWPWNNDLCYSSNRKNDLLKLNDTLWTCLTDSVYSDFVMPFDGKVTSRYGYRRGRYHNGIDIDLQTGDTVVAAFDGKVRYSKYNKSGFGNLIVIRHYNGLETFYAHLSELLVVPNQWVKAGDPIGLGGNTGRSYGAHLHFETRFYDAPINPEEVIDFKNKRIVDENLFIHKGLFYPGAAPSFSAAKTEAYYRIRKGDTLGHIARRNKTTISQICRLNNISSNTILRLGRTLRVR